MNRWHDYHLTIFAVLFLIFQLLHEMQSDSLIKEDKNLLHHFYDETLCLILREFVMNLRKRHFRNPGRILSSFSLYQRTRK